MRILSMTLVAASAAAMLGASAGAEAASDAAGRWSGTYRYEFVGEPGSGVAVAYTLVLRPGVCRLTAQGFQTDETIRCQARTTGDRLDVIFKSFGDGKVSNKYGVAEYSAGATLLVLRAGASADRPLTEFRAYELLDGEPRAAGVYFKR